MSSDSLDIDPRGAISKFVMPWLCAMPLCFAACAMDATDDVAADADLKHCAVGPDGEATCYATFTEAIARATGGRITDAPAGPDDVMDQDAFTARVNGLEQERISNAARGVTTQAITVLIGTVYKSANFSLDEQTWNFFLPDRGCDGSTLTVELAVTNLNERPFTVSDMNDEISSFRSYSGCSTLMWSDWFFTGATTNFGVPAVNMAYVGDTMNDEASSIRWY